MCRRRRRLPKHIHTYTHKISWWCPDFICFVCNNTSYEPTSCQKIYQSTQIYTILFCKMMMMEYGLYIRLYIIIWHECVILFVEYGPCVRVCVYVYARMIADIDCADIIFYFWIENNNSTKFYTLFCIWSRIKAVSRLSNEKKCTKWKQRQRTIFHHYCNSFYKRDVDTNENYNKKLKKKKNEKLIFVHFKYVSDKIKTLQQTVIIINNKSTKGRFLAVFSFFLIFD